MPPVSEPVAASELFYERALTRINRIMLGLAIAFSAAAVLRYGTGIALGFVCGCVIAYLNFHWLKRGVGAFADSVTRSGTPRSSTRIVLLFILRYLLMGLAAYAIFTVSRASLYGLLAGLFLPVAAIMCEAMYEVGMAIARGM